MQTSGTASGLVAGIEPLTAIGSGGKNLDLNNINSRGTNLTGLSSPDAK